MSNALKVRIVSLMPKGDILTVNAPVEVPAPLPETQHPTPLVQVSPWKPLALNPAEITGRRANHDETVAALPEQPIPFRLPIKQPGDL